MLQIDAGSISTSHIRLYESPPSCVPSWPTIPDRHFDEKSPLVQSNRPGQNTCGSDPGCANIISKSTVRRDLGGGMRLSKLIFGSIQESFPMPLNWGTEPDELGTEFDSFFLPFSNNCFCRISHLNGRVVLEERGPAAVSLRLLRMERGQQKRTD